MAYENQFSFKIYSEYVENKTRKRIQGTVTLCKKFITLKCRDVFQYNTY